MRQCPNCKTNNQTMPDSVIIAECGFPNQKEETLYSDLDELEEAPEDRIFRSEIEEESEKSN